MKKLLLLLLLGCLLVAPALAQAPDPGSMASKMEKVSCTNKIGTSASSAEPSGPSTIAPPASR